MLAIDRMEKSTVELMAVVVVAKNKRMIFIFMSK